MNADGSFTTNFQQSGSGDSAFDHTGSGFDSSEDADETTPPEIYQHHIWESTDYSYSLSATIASIPLDSEASSEANDPQANTSNSTGNDNTLVAPPTQVTDFSYVSTSHKTGGADLNGISKTSKVLLGRLPIGNAETLANGPTITSEAWDVTTNKQHGLEFLDENDPEATQMGMQFVVLLGKVNPPPPEKPWWVKHILEPMSIPDASDFVGPIGVIGKPAKVALTPIGKWLSKRLARESSEKIVPKIAKQPTEKVVQKIAEEAGKAISRTDDAIDVVKGTEKIIMEEYGKFNAPVKGFSSFDALKRALGPAGEGKQWHHIVEQSKVGQFGANAIHSVDNVIAVPTPIHTQISAFFSSKQPFTNGLTVRNWLDGQSFEYQRQFGLDILKRFGVQ